MHTPESWKRFFDHVSGTVNASFTLEKISKKQKPKINDTKKSKILNKIAKGNIYSPWNMVKEAFSRFGNARNRFPA